MPTRYQHNPEFYRSRETRTDENILADLINAGLSASYAPKEDTRAARDINALARRYMATIVKLDSSKKRLENYELHQLDEQRHYYHQMLCTKLLGIPYERLSPTYKRAISNFAAYLTNRKDYVDTF